MLYWTKGNKTENALGMSNSDPHLHRAFMAWTREYHDPAAVFRASLNLHADNDEPAARAFWVLELGLDDSDFNQTFIKPDGTGQRRNHLPYGVAKIRVRKSTDMFLTTMGLIDGLRRSWDTQSH